MDHGVRDGALVARLKAGEPEALREVAHRYGPRIQQLAFRYLRNKEDAEEVTQDVLYKVHRKIGAFRGDAALSSWIYRITFNVTMSKLRSAGYRRSQSEQNDRLSDIGNGEQPRAEAALADWSHTPDEQVLRGQARRRMLRAILALPAIYRAPVVLRDLQGMSTEEASEVLKVKDQTLKSRLHRGRLILREQLSDLAGGLSLRHAYGM
jgi:RNA polymerase sigma-70 factor (ECF subfamily)